MRLCDKLSPGTRQLGKRPSDLHYVDVHGVQLRVFVDVLHWVAETGHWHREFRDACEPRCVSCEQYGGL